MKLLDGYEGTTEQQIISTYLAAGDDAFRDRFIESKGCESGNYGDPCLVQVCEGTQDWVEAPVSSAVGKAFLTRGMVRLTLAKAPCRVVPFTFDDAYIAHGQPLIARLKAECAQLNGSTPAEIEAMGLEVGA